MVSFDVTGIAGGHRVTLVPVLDLVAAGPLLDAVRGVASGRLEVDAGAVERLSTPCLQVLLAAARAVADAGGEFVLVSPSEQFLEALGDLGLFDVLAEWKIQ